jgi:hypothetical protein
MLSVAPQSQQGNLHTQFATTKKMRIYTTANITKTGVDSQIASVRVGAHTDT